MSEKSKGDTSMNPTPSRIVQNPLLSASVTGLSFDDFPNKPLLLPAAPAVLHAPQPSASPPPPVISTGIIGRESKSLVTVGQSSNIDNETLSEINLNATAEDTQPALIDTNSNPLLDPNLNSDSIFNQAASSFSALPSVASNVLSTFSKRLYSGSTSRERTPLSDSDLNANPISQLDIQPQYTQQQHYPQQQQFGGPLAPPPSFATGGGSYYAGFPPPTQFESLSTGPPPEPPKLYNPSEVPAISSASGPPPPTATGQNTYRLSAKKKTYAPIPGFSEETTKTLTTSTVPPQALAAPIVPVEQTPPSQIYSQSSYQNPFNQNQPQQQSYQYKDEDRKGKLFSITTGVFQNLTGLVQSAAGTIAQTVKVSDTSQQPQQQFQPQQQISVESNYYAGVGHFQPQPETFGSSIPPPPPNFYISGSNQPSVTTTSNLFTSTPYPTVAKQQQLGLPALPTQDIYTTALASEEQTQKSENTSDIPPPLGFDQFLSDPTTPKSEQSVSETSTQLPPVAIYDPNRPSSQNTVTEPLRPPSIPSVDQSSVQYFAPNQPLSALTTTSNQKQPSTSVSDPLRPPSHPSAVQTSIQFFDPTQPLSAPSLTPAALFHQNRPQSTNSPISQPIQFFDPTKSHPQIEATKSPTLQAPGIESLKSAAQPLVGSTQTAPLHSTSQAGVESVPIQFFNPSAIPAPPTLFHPPLPQASEPQKPPLQSVKFLDPSQLPQETRGAKPPTAVATHIPPISVVQPPTASGQTTTFRLQKGTRHYKNPLSATETAPNFGQAPPLVPPPSTQSIFNPFATSAGVSSEQTQVLFTPKLEPRLTEQQSVPIFTPQPVTKSAEPESLALIVNKANSSVKEVKAASLDLYNPFDSKETFLHPQNKELNQTCVLSNPITDRIQTPWESAETSAIDSAGQSIEAAISSTQSLKENSTLIQTIPSSESNIDPLEETLRTLTLPEPEISENSNRPAANFLPPPPQITTTQGPHSNPYRKDLTTAHPISTTGAVNIQPSLANFFTPSSPSTADFNFFLPAQQDTSFSAAASSFNKSNPSTTNFFSQTEQRQPTQQDTELPTASSENYKTVEKSAAEKPVALEELLTDNSGDTSTRHPVISAPLVLDAQIPNLTDTEPTESKLPQELTSNTKKEHTEEFKQTTETLNSFSNLFTQTSDIPKKSTTTSQQSQTLPNLSSFFDTLSPKQVEITGPTIGDAGLSNTSTTSESNLRQVPLSQLQQQQHQQQQQSNEEQLIQNFFNNPPPQEESGVGDLNYDLVHSGLAVKNLHTRSLTPFSNLVEPPSSSCSEFSELSSSIAGQKQNPSPLSLDYLIKSNAAETKVSTTLGDKKAASELNNSVEEVTAPSPDDLSKHYADLPEEILAAFKMANSVTSEKNGAAPSQVTYSPAVKHWFYKRSNGLKFIWTPFSHYDSALLETTLTMGPSAPNIVAVEGGRYDVNIQKRTKTPVYWEGPPLEVRRCSWFYKAIDSRYVPYDEETAELLEAEYKQANENKTWHKKIIIGQGEQVVFHGPTVIVHFQQQQNVDAWGGSSQTTTRPRVVKRDLDDFIIDQGESQRVDHLLFMVHGIGAACDLKMRTVEEVVDEFRTIAQQLVQSHYKNSFELGLVGRVEVLPISWHSHLHSGEMGIDAKLKSITLDSIPKLRNFTNDTLLDVLFYTSPTYCQKIMNTVAASMNSVYLKYRERNPEFSGGVSLAGHSLGSLILFDLLCHQKPIKESEEQNMENPDHQFLNSDNELSTMERNQGGIGSNQISYTMGAAGTGQPSINYAQLIFQPKKLFALGSPIGMFVTIRGIDNLGLDFRLPTCPGFYNIFHPFDPVAYRIEALVNPDMSGIRPVLIPHHKGRKRMHLELKETMARVGADLKQRFLDTFKTTLESVNFLAPSSSTKNKTDEVNETMEKEVDEVLEMQMKMENQCRQDPETPEASSIEEKMARRRTDSTSTNHSQDSEMVELDFSMGKLNDSKRIDYVLQEAPLEFFNEYLFALSSHVCYWESSDTILFVMKEIYSGLGVSRDSQVPQQSMTIERPSGSTSPTK